MGQKTYEILSIEDNEPDFTLLETALNRIPDISINLINIKDGQKAINYIFKRKEFKEAKTPHLIILDINLPKIDGFEILKKIKKSKKYKIIPVIMFSTSNLMEDIIKSYEESVNSYIIKSFDIQNIFNKIATMGEYWLKTATIPETHLYLVGKENM